MLMTGTIPEVLTPKWITPIWKGTDHEEEANYRPLVITNHILKVIECVNRQQMSDYSTLTKRQKQ